MQSVNKRAPTPVFMTLLFGTAAMSAGLGVYALLQRDEPQASWLLGGSLSYLASIVITATFHIPRNDKLAKLDPAAADSARSWTTYLSQWTAGNHLRTLTCATAAVLFVIAHVGRREFRGWHYCSLHEPGLRTVPRRRRRAA